MKRKVHFPVYSPSPSLCLSLSTSSFPTYFFYFSGRSMLLCNFAFIMMQFFRMQATTKAFCACICGPFELVHRRNLLDVCRLRRVKIGRISVKAECFFVNVLFCFGAGSMMINSLRILISKIRLFS